MTRRKALCLTLSLSLLLSLLAWPTPAHACSCALQGTAPPQLFQTFDAVFDGTPVGAVDLAQQDFWYHELQRLIWGYADGSFAQMRYTFAVQTAWKGVRDTEVFLQTGYGGGDCGIPFQLGQRYLVYALRLSNGDWATNICMQTKDYSAATTDLAFLATQTPLPLTPKPLNYWPWLWACLGALLAAGLGLGGFFIWRRRAQQDA